MPGIYPAGPKHRGKWIFAIHVLAAAAGNESLGTSAAKIEYSFTRRSNNGTTL